MSTKSLRALSSYPQQSVPAPPFRWGTRILLPIVILLAFGGLFASSTIKSLTPAMDVSVTPVIEQPAIKKQISATTSSSKDQALVQAAGWIEPDPYPVYATTLISGSIDEVLFLEGDTVKEGQQLVRLNGEDDQLSLKRAEAEFRAAQEIWESNIEHTRNAAVTEAAVRETSATLALARAELDRELALQKIVDRIYHRRKELVDEGSISSEEFESAEAESIIKDANVRVIKERINEQEAELDRLIAENHAAKRNLELRTEERRRLELAKVALEEARLHIQRLTIVAPMDGVVMRRLVEPGGRLMVGTDNMETVRVAELYDPEHLQVRVDVPLADAAKIGVGQPAKVIVEVLPDRSFDGVVSRLTNLADIQKNTLEVKVALKDPAPELKPEMLARVKFFASPQNSTRLSPAYAMALFAPGNAIQDDGVWVVSEFDGESGIAVRKKINSTGATANDWKEISEGLNLGDLIITSPTNSLTPGQRVRVTSQEGSI
jgi:HlyD family secretion protein